MKILITGGRGFIGGHVCRELEIHGHEVFVLSNLSHPSKNTELRNYSYGDIRYNYDVYHAVKGMDCVIHLAAKINVDRSRDDARPFVDTNICGTYNVIEACRKCEVKLVYASTSEVLGSLDERFATKLGMNESYPYMPDNPYGATKAAADMLVVGWIRSYGLDATILRSFNIAGIGQSYDKEGAFIPKVIEKIIHDENPIIFGAGNQTRDYVWVNDVARAYRKLVEDNYSGEIFHIGTGIETTITYVAEKLIEISGKNLEVEYVTARPRELKRLKCDYAKAKVMLDWVPSKSIDDILKEMYQARMLEELK